MPVHTTSCGAAQDACEAQIQAKFEGLDAATSCFGKLEAKQRAPVPSSLCTTTGDANDLETMVDSLVGDVVATLEGNPPPTCGNGVAEPSESCDNTDLGGASCGTLDG